MKYHFYPLKLFIRKLPVLILVSGVVVLNLFSWLWLLLQIPHNAEQIFLHYNILFGVDKIGGQGEMYLTPLIGFFIMVVNGIGAWVVYKKDWFFSYTLLAMAVIVNIFVAISSILVVFLNI